MSLRCLTGEDVWASGYAGAGATGSEIELSGSILNSQTLAPDSEYAIRIIDPPPPGVLISELGVQTLNGVADGTYTWTYQLYEDGVPTLPYVTMALEISNGGIINPAAHIIQGRIFGIGVTLDGTLVLY